MVGAAAGEIASDEQIVAAGSRRRVLKGHASAHHGLLGCNGSLLLLLLNKIGWICGIWCIVVVVVVVAVVVLVFIRLGVGIVIIAGRSPVTEEWEGDVRGGRGKGRMEKK